MALTLKKIFGSFFWLKIARIFYGSGSPAGASGAGAGATIPHTARTALVTLNALDRTSSEGLELS